MSNFKKLSRTEMRNVLGGVRVAGCNGDPTKLTACCTEAYQYISGSDGNGHPTYSTGYTTRCDCYSAAGDVPSGCQIMPNLN